MGSGEAEEIAREIFRDRDPMVAVPRDASASPESNALANA